MRQVKTAVVTAAAQPSAGPLSRQGIAAALDWWREAGVDCDFLDEPRAWLAPPEPEAPPASAAKAAPRAEPAVPQRERIGGDPATWPTELAAFRAWWLAEPTLDHGRIEGRLPSRGEAGAALLILVEHPEPTDRDALLSGDDGKLLSGFLDAAGLTTESVAVASVLPRHTPHADWAQLRADRLGEVLLHHLGLLAPQRVVAFGGNILPLLGHDPAKTPDILLPINQEGASVPVLAARDLTALRARPAWKAHFWRRWLDWTG